MRNYFVVLINSAKIMRLKIEYIDYGEKKVVLVQKPHKIL